MPRRVSAEFAFWPDSHYNNVGKSGASAYGPIPLGAGRQRPVAEIQGGSAAVGVEASHPNLLPYKEKEKHL